MTLWSLSIFDRLVVSVKVSLSYKQQVAIWPLKTCVEVLTVKDLVRTMSELCQRDRLWILYIFLPFNPTLETSPLGTFTDPVRIEVAAYLSSILPVAISPLLASHLILATNMNYLSQTLSDSSFTSRRYKLVYQIEPSTGYSEWWGENLWLLARYLSTMQQLQSSKGQGTFKEVRSPKLDWMAGTCRGSAGDHTDIAHS